MSNKNKTINVLKRVLETLWLVVALFALAIAVRETSRVGIKESLLFYLFSGIAFFFYFIRRKQRKNIEP